MLFLYFIRINYTEYLCIDLFILALIPQRSNIAPFLYSIFAHDTPTSSQTSLGTYTDDTIILASNNDPQVVSLWLQNHLNLIRLWSNRWKIKINEAKSSFVTFSLRPGDCLSVLFNNNQIPITPTIKYLGLTFDRRLTWAQHLKN